MSRVGKRPIVVPSGVNVKIDKNLVTVKGPKGELHRTVSEAAILSLDGGILTVSFPDEKQYQPLWGLTRTLVGNMVIGVTTGYERNLEINGVGYRAQKGAESVAFHVGYNHPIDFSAPAGITLAVEGTNKVKVVGADKELVGETAARIRGIRPCDHYKGKGIKYAEEKLRLKPGKAGKAAAKK
jgi:large subunit ribosomal protein L6